jgi:hypothetical protein
MRVQIQSELENELKNEFQGRSGPLRQRVFGEVFEYTGVWDVALMDGDTMWRTWMAQPLSAVSRIRSPAGGPLSERPA